MESKRFMKENWIYVPKEASSLSYDFHINSGRLKSSRELELRLHHFPFCKKNTSTDSLGRDFIGTDSENELLIINSYLGFHTPSIREMKEYLNLLYNGLKNKIEVYEDGSLINSKICGDYLLDVIGTNYELRGEVLDGRIISHPEEKDSKAIIKYGSFFDGDFLENKYEEFLDPETLLGNRVPGISFEDWLKNSTSQGLANNKIKKGEMYYLFDSKNFSRDVKLVAMKDGFGIGTNLMNYYHLKKIGIRPLIK